MMALALAVTLVGGRGAAEGAEPLGPFCMTLDLFSDRLELFALPTGGGQFLLTVHNVNFPNSYVGSLVVLGGELIFTFVTGRVDNAAAVTFSGVLNAGTFSGPGKCVIVPSGGGGCGTGTALVFTVTNGACAR
jgi:hypothetical protein